MKPFQVQACTACLLILVSTLIAQDNEAARPVLRTGITGLKTESGVNDPQYVLSFVPIQRLMLEATKHPLSQAEVKKALAGTPVSENDLLCLVPRSSFCAVFVLACVAVFTQSRSGFPNSE
jgi:hypothetical protein